MAWTGMTIWLIDEGPEADRAWLLLQGAIGPSGQWANWRVIGDLEEARAAVASVSHVHFPHVAVISSSVGGVANSEARTSLQAALEQRAVALDVRPCLSFTLDERWPGRPTADSLARNTLQRIENGCSRVARQLLEGGYVPIPAGASVVLEKWVQLLADGAEARRIAGRRFETELSPRIAAVIARCRAHGAVGEVKFALLSAAATPRRVEDVLARWNDPIAALVREELQSPIAEARKWWLTQELLAEQAVDEVWRELNGNHDYQQLWRVSPFAARRLWSREGSSAFIDDMAAVIGAMSELLEDAVDHAMALTRLFKKVRIKPGEPTRPTTVFAHMLHSSSPEVFERQFQFELPADEAEQERLLRIELYGEENVRYPRVRHVHLPKATVDRIWEDAVKVNADSEDEALVAFCRPEAQALSHQWCVDPATCMQRWPGLQGLDVRVSRRGRPVLTPRLLTDWRLVQKTVENLVSQLGRPKDVDVVYSYDNVDLIFDLALTAFSGLPLLTPDGGGVGGTLEELKGWCSEIRLETNDPKGNCSAMVHRQSEWSPTGRNRIDPFMKIALRFPHYNNTREGE